MKCARCHSHKFDPIPHRDYYRSLAVFKGASTSTTGSSPTFDRGLGPKAWMFCRAACCLTSPPPSGARGKRTSKHQKEIESLKVALDKRASALTTKDFEERLAKLPAELRDDLRAMLATAPEKRDAMQKNLAEKYEKQLRIDRNQLKTLDPAFKKESDETDARVRAIQARGLQSRRSRRSGIAASRRRRTSIAVATR